jgi:hypothetical protein
MSVISHDIFSGLECVFKLLSQRTDTSICQNILETIVWSHMTIKVTATTDSRIFTYI